MTASRLSVRAAVVAAGLLLGAPAAGWAQGNPSADQIINSLKPGGGMMGGTRGIRPVGPAPAPEAPAGAAGPGRGRATPASVARAPGAGHVGAPGAGHVGASGEGPAAGPAAPSVNLTVQFATGSAELTPAAVRTLTELGRALASSTLGSYRFRIEGHTDTVGGADANKALSDRRAQAVVAFLQSQFRIDPARLDAVGMGEDGLLVQTPPNTPDARNRRVQVINLGA